MALTAEELSKWNVEKLRKYLNDRGVPLSGSCRKADMIEKAICADKLSLPVQPSQQQRLSEISCSRKQHLFIDGVQIPFPESVKEHLLGGSEYFPDLTLDALQSYAEATTSMKAFKEGKNLQHSGHVEFLFSHRITETIKFCFIKALVAPQTRIAESPYSVPYSTRYGFVYVTIFLPS